MGRPSRRTRRPAPRDQSRGGRPDALWAPWRIGTLWWATVVSRSRSGLVWRIDMRARGGGGRLFLGAAERRSTVSSEQGQMVARVAAHTDTRHTAANKCLSLSQGRRLCLLRGVCGESLQSRERESPQTPHTHNIPHTRITNHVERTRHMWHKKE